MRFAGRPVRHNRRCTGSVAIELHRFEEGVDHRSQIVERVVELTARRRCRVAETGQVGCDDPIVTCQNGD